MELTMIYLMDFLMDLVDLVGQYLWYLHFEKNVALNAAAAALAAAAAAALAAAPDEAVALAAAAVASVACVVAIPA
jgi:hypothetical protein